MRTQRQKYIQKAEVLMQTLLDMRKRESGGRERGGGGKESGSIRVGA